jgi:hypothetical protein
MAAHLHGECAPLPTFITGGQVATCYRPTHVMLAERRLSTRPVSPLAAVAGVVPVRLSQVVVLTALGRGHPFAIAYVFGRPPTKPCPPGAHCPRPFDFAIVQETVGHTTAAGAGVSYSDLRHGKPSARGGNKASPGIPLVESNTRAQTVYYIAARALSGGATLLTFDEDLAKVMQRKQVEG